MLLHTSRHKATDKPERLGDFSKGSGVKNPWHGNAVGAVCITLWIGIKSTLLRQAIPTVAFQQPIYQRLVSYWNEHQSTVSEGNSKTTAIQREGPVAVHCKNTLNKHTEADVYTLFCLSDLSYYE